MLPKKERIKKGSEIKEIIRSKTNSFSTPLLYLLAKENSGNHNRLAIICSKKLGKAVVRNKIRRVLMQAYLKNKHIIKKNNDIVIIPRSEIYRVNDAIYELEVGFKALKIC